MILSQRNPTKFLRQLMGQKMFEIFESLSIFLHLRNIQRNSTSARDNRAGTRANEQFHKFENSSPAAIHLR